MLIIPGVEKDRVNAFFMPLATEENITGLI